MSLFDYHESQEIDCQGYQFDSLIMAAMRKADDDNLMALRLAFPETYKELKARYSAPGGRLKEEEDLT